MRSVVGTAPRSSIAAGGTRTCPARLGTQLGDHDWDIRKPSGRDRDVRLDNSTILASLVHGAARMLTGHVDHHASVPAIPVHGAHDEPDAATAPLTVRGGVDPMAGTIALLPPKEANKVRCTRGARCSCGWLRATWAGDPGSRPWARVRLAGDPDGRAPQATGMTGAATVAQPHCPPAERASDSRAGRSRPPNPGTRRAAGRGRARGGVGPGPGRAF